MFITVLSTQKRRYEGNNVELIFRSEEIQGILDRVPQGTILSLSDHVNVIVTSREGFLATPF